MATSLVVREDALTLYGFAGDDERNTFELLQTATGVGPRLALAMLAVFSPDALRRAVATEDLAALTTVPGIGRKGAQRIVLELAGRLGSPGEVPAGEGEGPAGEGEGPGGGTVGRGWSAASGGDAGGADSPVGGAITSVGGPAGRRAARRRRRGGGFGSTPPAWQVRTPPGTTGGVDRASPRRRSASGSPVTWPPAASRASGVPPTKHAARSRMCSSS